MNASVNPSSKDRLTADQRANEPSMEEILASIRRIISETDTRPTSAAAPVPAPVPAPVIVEKRIDTVSHMPKSQDSTRRQEATVKYEPASKPEPVIKRDETIIPMVANKPAVAEPIRANFADFFEQTAPPLRGTMQAEFQAEPEKAAPVGMLSTESNQAVAGAFAALSTVQSVKNKQNMDELVTGILKPMLKTWLDDNLPVLVEKLVRAEIERVSRGGN
eukprot:gene11909-12004_t